MKNTGIFVGKIFATPAAPLYFTASETERKKSCRQLGSEIGKFLGAAKLSAKRNPSYFFHVETALFKFGNKVFQNGGGCDDAINLYFFGSQRRRFQVVD